MTSLSLVGRTSTAFRLVLLLSLAHIPLGVVIYNQPIVGLLHQVCVFAFAFYCALRDRTLERVAVAIAYVIGAEVLWRMGGVSIYWELAKFASSLVLIVALVRRGGYKVPLLPVLYLAVLVPACAIPLVNETLGDARNILSSTMSGPFFLCIACIFFANVTLTRAGLARIIVAGLLPLFSVAFVTLFYTVSAPEIHFTGESNFATSGGFGPNQVSSMLGLGAFLALLLLINFRNSFKVGVFLVVTALLMTAQSVMTFSRGGTYNTVGAIAATALVLFRDPSGALRRLVPIVIAGVVFLGLIFPLLDDFTGGTLRERFEDTQGTNRTEILSADLSIFYEQPVLGAGVGMAYELRQEYLARKAMSHTEFARLLAEHGALGLLAIALLLLMAISNVGRQATTFGKALFVGMLVWSSLFMMNAGMRLAAPSFLWGMTFASIVNTSHIRPRRPQHSRAISKIALSEE